MDKITLVQNLEIIVTLDHAVVSFEMLFNHAIQYILMSW